MRARTRAETPHLPHPYPMQRRILNSHAFGGGGGSPVAASIVALWDFEDGARTADSAGENDLTVTGSPTYSEGKIGDAVGGFSSNNYLGRSNIVGPSGSSARSLSLWFKTLSTSSSHASMLYFGDGGGAAGRALSMSIEAGVFWVRTNAGRIASYGSGYNDGNWHYVTLTMPSGADLSDILIFIDGVAVARESINNDGPMDTSGIITRVGLDATSAFFTGDVDTVTVADREWSLSEHQWAYNSGAGRATADLLTS